jgi:O-antigen/teichoic acid export membrane protein
VIIGFKVYGAVLGFVIGILVALAVSLINIKPIMSSTEKPAKLDYLKIQATPVIFITTFIVIFYSIDVLIAKIVFTNEIAGFYSIASILAKAIFWGSQPISKAMFPLTSENSTNKKKRRTLLLNALSIISLCIAIALILFYFFPDFIVSIFAGKSLPESAAILFYVSIATSLVAITNLNLLYNLSTGKTKNYPYLVIFIIIEILLMFYFSSNLIEFTKAYILSAIIFLIGSIILLRHENSNNYTGIQ